MRILITGSAGFVGSHLTEKYVKEGHIVLGLDNFLSGSLDNIKHLLDYSNFKLIEGDIRNKDLLEKVMRGCDYIFHLAAQVHVDRSMIEPELTWDINVMGTQKLLEMARFYDVKRFIHASSSEVYGTALYVPQDENHPLCAPHPYGASKTAGDRMCYAYQRAYNMDIVIVRPFNIFGERQRDKGYGGVISIFARRVLNNVPPIIFGDGSQSREYTYVSDMVDAYDRIMRYNLPIREPINVGTGEEITIKELAYKIIEICDKKLEPVFDKPRMAEVDRLVTDATKARILLGWKPKVSIDDGLRKYIEWASSFGWERQF
jgi:UDP-glucose 4-epimerase